jgi:preprotein translocase subunit SecG
MATVLLIIHILIAVVLIGVVLLQRSEGGALGIGGGGAGSFMTGRGAANFLTRVTAGLAAAFFATSLLLSLVATRSSAPGSILDTQTGGQVQQTKVPKGQKEQKPSELPQIDLNKIPEDGPKVPQSQ